MKVIHYEVYDYSNPKDVRDYRTTSFAEFVEIVNFILKENPKARHILVSSKETHRSK